MTVNRTTLLDLPLPVTGTESGTWGDTTNNGLTQYLDIAIAGTLVLSTDADVTLTSTEGDSSATNIGATTAQYAILRWTATGSTTRNITALAQSKTYVVINATGGTQSIVLRGAGPTTGVTIISGEKALCVWNGSDFVKVSSSAAAGGSNTQVQYNSSGVLAGSSNMTFDGTSLTLGGNPTLSAGTANGVLYLNGSKVATSGSALTFDGTNFAASNQIIAGIGVATANVLARSNVSNGGSGFSQFLFGNASTDTRGFLSYSHASEAILFGTSSAEQMRLTSTGLGIGASSPGAKLDVYNSAASGISEIARFRWNNGGSGGAITWANQVGTVLSQIANSSDSNGNPLLFYVYNNSTALTKMMTLDGSGNLGLGVTPSAWGGGYKAMTINQGRSIAGTNTGAGDFSLVFNAFYDATDNRWEYEYTGDPATRYSTNSGTHAWYTAPSGTAGNAITFTQAMTLDASGDLMIGTTTKVPYSGNAGSTNFTLSGTSNPTTARPAITLKNSDDSARAWWVIDANNGAFIGTQTNNYFGFQTNNTERARIDSSGNWLVGTTSQLNGTGATISTDGRTSSCTLGIQAHNAAGYDARIYFECPGSDSAIITFQRSPVRLFASVTTENSGPYVTSNGTSWTTNSDRRLKTNIESINHGLASVMALAPKKYAYKNNEEKQCLGFIAQDVVDVIPEIVDAPEDANEMMGIDYQSIIPVLVKAIQEQQALITSLTARVALLEGN